MVPHRALSNQLLWRRQAYGFTAADRLLQVLPLGFDPSLWELLAPLVTGGRLVLARQGGHQDGRYLADLISRQRITVLEVVPRLLRLLLDEPGFDSCNALRRVFCGGEVLTAELCDRFFARSAAALANVYGPTEATIVATCWECVRPTSEPAPRRAVVSNGGEHGNMGAGVPIGRAIPNTRALLLDERGQPTPPGETGELYLGGAGLARGYLNRPDLTAERFVLLPADGRADGAQRLYRTGDLARSLPDGSFVFLGRVDDQVKIRGFRVEPAEVEAVLAAHPGVRECAVIARRDARGDHRLVAYVCERGAALGAPHASGSLVAGARALRDYLLARLPEHMVPSAFVAMDALPLTPSGKLDTHALPDPAVAPPAVGAGSLAPRDGVEAQLAAIWRDILQVPAVGVRDDFFALGGDSLQVMALVAEIETQLGRALLGSAIYETRTIERLARLLQADPDASPLVAVQPEGTWPPLFLVGAGHGDLPGFYRLASYLGADQPLFALQPPAKTEEYAAYTSLPLLAAAYIEQVRLVQGEGPYVLAGYSAGGIVAFEMAQQLRAQRAEVVAVVILDSQFPVPFGADYLLFRGLRRVAGALAWRGLWRTGSQIQQMLADPGFEVTFRALCGYRPRRYVGTVALLLAERSYVRRSPTPWQWRRVAPELATHVVPGGHFSALHEPHVVALAQRVRAVLDAAVHS
jgi:amino acid adenylation domain-containing protein